MTITFSLIHTDVYAITMDGMRVDTAVLTDDGYFLDQGERFANLNAALTYVTDNALCV